MLASLDKWTDAKDFYDVHATIKRGDVLGVRGVPGRANKGELSIRANEVEQLSYCLHMLPAPPTSITTLNKDTRYRQRYLDLIVNNSIQKKFKVRSQIINYI